MEKKDNNFCSFNVTYIDEKGQEKTQSLCSYNSAIVYANNRYEQNCTIISITRGFNY